MKVIGCKSIRGEYFSPVNCVPDITEDDIIENNRRAVLEGKIPTNLAVNLDLYYYGTFDDKSGHFNFFDEPKFLVSLADFVPASVKAKMEA